MAEFNRIIAEAEALVKERPVLTTLTDTQIKRMAEAYYADMLLADEEERREGTGSEPLFQSIAKQLEAAGIEYDTPFAVGSVPEGEIGHSVENWLGTCKSTKPSAASGGVRDYLEAQECKRGEGDEAELRGF